jgi:lysophospholipase L1-like esterase
LKRKLHAIAAFAMLAGIALPHGAGAENRIEWRLENSFRLFKQPEHTELHRRALESLSEAERETPILAAERKLAEQSGGRGWAEPVFNNTCYNQDGDRYDACPHYVMPRSHRVLASLRRQQSFFDLFSGGWLGHRCYWQLESETGEVMAETEAPCHRAAVIDVPYPAGGRLAVYIGGNPAALPVEVRVRDLLIVGLGDSFGAGEGNPDRPVRFDDSRDFDYGFVDIAATGERQRMSGYPAREGNWSRINSDGFVRERARWLDRECHRSLYSHQLRAALQLALENDQRAVTFVGLACSGAEIPEGLLLPKPVRECTPGEPFATPAQLSQLSEELCQTPARGAPMPAAIIQRVPELRNVSEDDMRVTRCAATPGPSSGLKRPIDLVFLSVGGNDVGFTPIVSDSLLGENSIYRTLGAATGSVYGVEQARKRLDLVKQRFDGLRFALELFFRIHSGESGQAPVVLTGYPPMGYDRDGLNTCSGARGMEVFPPFQLDAAKVGKGEEFSDELNARLAEIAGHDWSYVDGYRVEFLSHGLCASSGDSVAENLGFPRAKGGQWSPFAPSAYLPYSPRQRWFRTPNDAFLTANMHAAHVSNFGANCSGLFTGVFKQLARRHWTPFQVFMASTYGGAFHPSAEGQARIADEVVKAARAILGATP